MLDSCEACGAHTARHAAIPPATGMSAPADTLPWSAVRRRNYAGRQGAPPPGKGPAGRTPLLLRPDGWRSRRRSRDPSAEHEPVPTTELEGSAGVSRAAFRDLQEPFNDARR